MGILSKTDRRVFRHTRVRKAVVGTVERPRLNVFRSAKHISVQIIDDLAGHTLVAVSSSGKDMKAQFKTGANLKAARAIGKLVAQKAKEKGIQTVVFDRGGYLYHGRIKELAEGCREGGLKF